MSKTGAEAIVDAHVHLGRVKDVEYCADDLLSTMAANRVDRSVVFSFAERIDNEYVLQAADANPDAFIPFMVINPWSDTALSDLQTGLSSGFRGLKLHPIRHGYPLNRLWLVGPLLEVCANFDAPVIAFGGQDYFSTPDRFEDLARAFPSVTFIMAHMGFTMERDAAQRACATYENIYLETSGVTALRYITGAVEKAGPEKVVFGSNLPTYELEEAINTIKLAVPDEESQRLVLGGNLERILGL